MSELLQFLPFELRSLAVKKKYAGFSHHKADRSWDRSEVEIALKSVLRRLPV